MTSNDTTSNFRIFDAADDCPHPAERDESFQESALFAWHDLAAGVGGFWRCGQEPVVQSINSCFGMFTDDGDRFRSNHTGIALRSADRGETFMGCGPELRVDLDRLAIRADFADCEAQLVFEDFFPRYDHHQLIGHSGNTDHARAHYEVAGRVVGKVRIGRREFDVDGLGYRDRSWGPRKWGTLRSTRWWPAVFGPDLCVQTITVVDENYHGTFGYVMRDGIPYPLSNVDVVATMEYDALTPRSAAARFTFGDGETGALEHLPVDGIGLHVRGYTAIESIGRVRWGDRIGMSDFEINSNPSGGTGKPIIALGANFGDGLSRR